MQSDALLVVIVDAIATPPKRSLNHPKGSRASSNNTYNVAQALNDVKAPLKEKCQL